MILATIPHNGNTIQVEVLDAFEGASGRKVAQVRALDGQTFTAWTHGGWAASDTAIMPADLVDLAVSLPAAAYIDEVTR